MELLTAKNIKRAGKAVKYGVAFANAYKEMSQVLPINNLLPDFMTNNVLSQTMGATLNVINAKKSANEKRDCLLDGVKQGLERGDVSQFETLMQAMQAYAQRENDRRISELMQRMYGDMYGEAGCYTAPTYGVNDSLRSMVENCSLSPQNESTRQPHMMTPHQHHNGVGHAGTTAHKMCHNNPLPPPGHSMSSDFQNNPHYDPMQYSHCGPPVSHSHTTSGAPGNSHNIPSGPMVPYNSTSVGPTNNNASQHTVPLNNFSTSTFSCDNDYNTSAGSTVQPVMSCNSASATTSTTCNVPIMGFPVAYDNLCKAAPPASIAPLPPPANNIPFTGSASLQNAPVRNIEDSVNVTTRPTTYQAISNPLDQVAPKVDPNSHIDSTSNHTNYSVPAYPVPPVSQNSYTSTPVAPSAPYRNDANHTTSTVSHYNQAYTGTPQSAGYGPPPYWSYSHHAVTGHPAPHGNYGIHTAPRVPYNHATAYSAPLNNHSMPKTNHIMPYTAHQSNYRSYPVSKLPYGSYSIPTVSTVPGNTVITIPAVAPHSSCTVLKIPATPANVTILAPAESNDSAIQLHSQANAYRSPQPSSSLKSYATGKVSTSHRGTTSTSSTSGTGSASLSVFDGRRKVLTNNHKKGFSAQKQKADAYHKTMKKNYQELMSVLPINGMMNDLVEEGVITRKLQFTLDAKQSRQDKIQCILEKLEDSLKLGIPNKYEKLLCVMKDYGKRKNKSDLVQLVKKIRSEADELCTPRPKCMPSQQQLDKANQDSKLEEVHSKMTTLLPTLYKDDIIPEHLIKQLIVLGGPQEQAEFLIEKMEPNLSTDDVKQLMCALDAYDRDDDKSVEQVKLFFCDLK